MKPIKGIYDSFWNKDDSFRNEVEMFRNIGISQNAERLIYEITWRGYRSRDTRTRQNLVRVTQKINTLSTHTQRPSMHPISSSLSAKPLLCAIRKNLNMTT